MKKTAGPKDWQNYLSALERVEGCPAESGGYLRALAQAHNSSSQTSTGRGSRLQAISQCCVILWYIVAPPDWETAIRDVGSAIAERYRIW